MLNMELRATIFLANQVMLMLMALEFLKLDYLQ